jgi:hypothetical protein
VKRISMAGADIAVTDDRIADLVLEYAKELGRAGTTDTVTLPIARNHHVEQASLLIGPASQIALTEDHDKGNSKVTLPNVEDVLTDLQHRLRALAARYVPPPHAGAGPSSFDDLDPFAI